MDPYAVLGVPADAQPGEIAAAYRALAKRWHPDRAGSEDAQDRMAQINAAYELLRATAWNERAAQEPPKPRAAGRGAWLAPAIRRALGHELLRVLEPRENVWLVTPTTTWASPQALLAASDRRLIWLLDDAVNGRVGTLPFSAVESVRHTLRRPRRRVATLRLRAHDGRRLAFGELNPATAATLASRIRAASTA
jgi:DnaJ domain